MFKSTVVSLLAALLLIPASSAAETKHYRVAVSFYSQTIPLYVEMRKGMEAEAAKRGLDIEFSYSGPDIQQQANQIENMVTRKVDLILCSPFDQEGLINAYRDAKRAGIPVISVANRIASAGDEAAYIGYDLSIPGALAMKAAAKAIGGKGPIGIIEGPPSIAFVYNWRLGVYRVLKEFPNIKVVSEINGPLNLGAGLTEASNIITAHPDVKAILTVSDELAEATAQALHERGYPPAKVFVTGYDGYPHVVDMIKNNGGIDWTFATRGYTYGVVAVRTAADWLAGKRPKQHIIPPPTIAITHENAGRLTEEDIR